MTGRSGGQQDSLPQQTEAGPAIHLALDHFDPVDVAFDDARAPGQGEASDDGVAIPVDSLGKGVEDGKGSGATSVVLRQRLPVLDKGSLRRG